MPLLSSIARKKKIGFFLKNICPNEVVLEIGCGDGWVGRYLKANGYQNYSGLDISPPADIIGDIKDWRQLGLAPESFICDNRL